MASWNADLGAFEHIHCFMRQYYVDSCFMIIIITNLKFKLQQVLFC